MITEEERQSIVNEAVEKALLALPEVVGNLMMNQANLYKLNKAFYEKYPDFATSKDLVASVVERVEGSNPGIDYARILELAAPEIREKLKTMKGLDVKTVSKPNRNLPSLQLSSKSNNGEL